MLKTLNIKNYALIENIEINFESGLNILTGETGAGKSILIGALGTILGERVDPHTLRDGANKAVVEGIFAIKNNAPLIDFFKNHDWHIDDEQVILRREITDSGRSRAFANDTPVQLSVLQKIGDLLVDLHGQHEHQSLLQVQNHLRFIDLIGGLEDTVQQTNELYNSLKKLNFNLLELKNKQKTIQEKKDYLSFQLIEINNIKPLPGEETDLLNEEKLIQHGEKLFNLTTELTGILYEHEQSVYDQLNQALNKLNELLSIDDSFKQYSTDCNSAILIVEEIAKMCQTYNSKLEFSQERLDTIQSRLSELAGLKKKYNRSIDEILEYRKQVILELESYQSIDTEFEELQQQIDSTKATFSEVCLGLSEKRKGVAKEISKLIPEVLSFLGMPGSRFNVGIEYHNDPLGEVSFQGQNYKASGSGMDFVEFRISTNAGGEIRPLTKVASGGEISRIMLALKSILAHQGQTPVLVFDEIDIGISGRIASAVGRKLRDLAKYHQVICITHLPQIASMGEHHYLVAKKQINDKTVTQIKKLNLEERKEAIAKLLAGDHVSETHLKSAQELLQESLETVKE